MAYEPRLPARTQRQLREWVLGRFEDEEVQLEAVRQLEVLFQRIAADPTGAGTTAPGPIPGRKCVQQIKIDGIAYPVSVNYEILEDEEAIVVNGVSTQPL